jgi:hypothetical protein
MKSLLIAALLVLDTGATMRKHHHQHKHHHGAKQSLDNTVSLVHERQKKGMDHAFYKHRNMLNEREHMNVQMYDDLNDKLSDETFIGQAIENGDKKNL